MQDRLERFRKYGPQPPGTFTIATEISEVLRPTFNALFRTVEGTGIVTSECKWCGDIDCQRREVHTFILNG